MGYNTTVVVLNDALSDIENDPEFGRKLAQAIRRAGVHINRCIDIPAGSHANAAHIVETHHADATSIIAVGGNRGQQLGVIPSWRFPDDRALKDAAVAAIRAIKPYAET